MPLKLPTSHSESYMNVEHYSVHRAAMDGHPGSEEAEAEGLAEEEGEKRKGSTYLLFQSIN